MINETSQIIISGINASAGAIPITLQTTTTTNWTQLIISLLFSSLFLIYMFGSALGSSFKGLLYKAKLKSFKRNTNKNVLLIKHTQSDFFSSNMINKDTLSKIQEALLEFGGKDFDLILHTPGGEVFYAIFISRLLKKYPGKVRCIIPNYAMSGGTLLMLSCDEIYMGDGACAGPVDVQLGNLFKYGSSKSWDKIVKMKGKKADDQSISFDFMGKQYTKTMRDLLEETIDLGLSDVQKKKFIDFITNGNIEHAYNLTPEKLESFGFKIGKIPKEIQEKLIKIVISKSMEGVTYI